MPDDNPQMFFSRPRLHARRHQSIQTGTRDRWWFAVVAFVYLITSSAHADETAALRGKALLIGQSSYERIDPLVNPEHDARKLEALLDQLGFETDVRSDRNVKRLKRDLDEFAEDAEEYDVALLYYSGHGIEAGGENYLVPVDGDLSALKNAQEGLVPLSGVVRKLSANARIVIVLIDACRSNPFPEGTLVKTTANPKGLPVAKQGLGIPKGMFPAPAQSSTDAGSLGLVIGYAAEPGSVALDGMPGTSSPYAAALLKHLATQGVTFADVMTMVTEEVYLKTRAQQRPWTNASLRRHLFFGTAPENTTGDEADLRSARRSLLLTISATPRLTRSFVETLASNDDLPLDLLYGILKELPVDPTADPVKIEQQLRDRARKLKAFMAQRSVQPKTDPELIELAGLAERAQAEGAIGLALKYWKRATERADELGTINKSARENLKSSDLERATVYASHAAAAILAFDHSTAAQMYESAFEQVKPWNDDLAFRYKLEQAGALSDHGFYDGDNSALAQAIDAYHTALERAPRRTRPDDWAQAQNNLGNALQRLGERRAGIKILSQAAVAYRSALEIRTREHAPERWAATQNNLGNTLQILGLREPGTTSLSNAVEAYEAALSVSTQERSPLDWAQTQSNLGGALTALGQRLRDAATVNRAVTVFEQALEERSRASVPLEWALTQLNLGNALQALGVLKGDRALLERAVIAYGNALEVLSIGDAPFHWATAQDNLGLLFTTLGDDGGDVTKLRHAADAHTAALQVIKRETLPIEWARVYHNLGVALSKIGQRGNRSVELREATAVFEAVLQVWTRELAPKDWADTQHNLGTALYFLGRSELSSETLMRAATAFGLALQGLNREHDPLGWAQTQTSLGDTLLHAGKMDHSVSLLEKSRSAYRAASAAYAAPRLQHFRDYLNRQIEKIDAAITELE